MDLSYVLIKPMISEKTRSMTRKYERVAFRVHPEANKVQIKQAVEETLNVKVEDVTVVRKRSLKRRRQGRVIGRKPGYKKAYVKLAPGEIAKLEFIQEV